MTSVLIVDDDAATRELVCVTLETAPYDILTAADGEQALALAQAERPALLVLDVQMPGTLDGLAVCRLLKHDDRTKQMVVILLTAHGQAWDIQAGYDAGADAYLIKPFSPAELLGKMKSMMTGRPAAQGGERAAAATR